MEEKYLSAMGGQERRSQETRCQGGTQGPTQEQVLSWVDQVFHELRQNKVKIFSIFFADWVVYFDFHDPECSSQVIRVELYASARRTRCPINNVPYHIIDILLGHRSKPMEHPCL